MAMEIDAVTPAAAYTVPEFCLRNKIGKATLYALWRIGRGPRRLVIGRNVRITAAAENDWQRDLEAFPVPVFRAEWTPDVAQRVRGVK